VAEHANLEASYGFRASGFGSRDFKPRLRIYPDYPDALASYGFWVLDGDMRRRRIDGGALNRSRRAIQLRFHVEYGGHS